MPDEFSSQRVSGSDFIKVASWPASRSASQADASPSICAATISPSSATREFLAVNFARFYEAAITAVISRDILPLIITLPSKRLETFLSIRRGTFPSGCPRVALDCRIALRLRKIPEIFVTLVTRARGGNEPPVKRSMLKAGKLKMMHMICLNNYLTVENE